MVLVPAFLQEVVGQQERLLEEAEWSCVEARHRQNYLVNLSMTMMTMTRCDSPPAFRSFWQTCQDRQPQNLQALSQVLPPEGGESAVGVRPQ